MRPEPDVLVVDQLDNVELVGAAGRAVRRQTLRLVDTRVVYGGDNLEQLRKLPDACVDLIDIDPPSNSNRNYEVFWDEAYQCAGCGHA